MKISLTLGLNNAETRFVRRLARRLSVEFPAYGPVSEDTALYHLLHKALIAQMRSELPSEARAAGAVMRATGPVMEHRPLGKWPAGRRAPQKAVPK